MIGISGSQLSTIAGNYGIIFGKKNVRFVTVDGDDSTSITSAMSIGPQDIRFMNQSVATKLSSAKYIIVKSAADIASPWTYTMQDAGANADFLMTKGTQSIASHKSIDRLSFNQINTEYITGEFTIGVTGKQIQFISGGATEQKINFPTASSVTGYMFMLFNTGTSLLSCYPGPFAFLPGGKGMLAISNGTSWKHLGF